MASAAKNRQGRDTRRQLVRVAERLFAEHGVDGVSIRAVNAAADLGAASIHYHFGSKEKLVEAVIDEHGAWVSARVQARAAELAARPEPPRGVELVQAIAVPYLELLERERVRGLRRPLSRTQRGDPGRGSARVPGGARGPPAPAVVGGQPHPDPDAQPRGSLDGRERFAP